MTDCRNAKGRLRCFNHPTVFIRRLAIIAMVVLVQIAAGSARAKRPRLPEIRLSATNQVPVCVTPKRLMAFMHSRNHSRRLRRLFRNIAYYYKEHGEKLAVRWDYAFFQTMIETNFLTYKTGRGRWGDVDPKAFNFAGIGTTGGGVPGDKFPDISTGVKAQMQHLIAYSGELQKNPTAPRTRLKQEEIVRLSRKLRRPVRFDDLAGRWAVDRKYAHSIEWVARSFRKKYCTGKMLQIARAEARKRKLASRRRQAARARRRRLAADRLARKALTSSRQRAHISRSALGAASVPPRPRLTWKVTPPRPVPVKRCSVLSASFGGPKTLLIKARNNGTITYTALSVLAGFEKSMTNSYLKSHASGGGRTIGEYASKREALARAFALCPE
ncbi:MAG TPA: hypothetical protein ENJ99_00315 [Rhizobiales bacterium]|nr:hypothetical protein [Hyphomicrobiales bacterium]